MRRGLGGAGDEDDAAHAMRAGRRVHGDAHVRAKVTRDAATGARLESLHDGVAARDDRIRIRGARIRCVLGEEIREVAVVAQVDSLGELVDESLTGALDGDYVQLRERAHGDGSRTIYASRLRERRRAG